MNNLIDKTHLLLKLQVLSINRVSTVFQTHSIFLYIPGALHWAGAIKIFIYDYNENLK